MEFREEGADYGGIEVQRTSWEDGAFGAASYSPR